MSGSQKQRKVRHLGRWNGKAKDLSNTSCTNGYHTTSWPSGLTLRSADHAVSSVGHQTRSTNDTHTHTHTHTHTPAQTLCLNKTSDRIRVCAVPPQTTTTLSRYPDAKRILFLHVISLVFWREYLDLRGIRTSFIIYTLQQMLLEWWNKGDCGEGHVARMGRWVMRIIFWSESLKGRDQLGDLDVDVRIILELISEKYVKILWTGLIWHSIGTGGGLLRTRNWTFEFSKMWGISWLA